MNLLTSQSEEQFQTLTKVWTLCQP